MSQSLVADCVMMETLETKEDSFQQEDASPGQWVLEDWGTDDPMVELEDSQELCEAVQGSAVRCEWCQLPECVVQLVQTPHTRWLARLVCARSPAIMLLPKDCKTEKNMQKSEELQEEEMKRECKLKSQATGHNKLDVFKIVLPKGNISTPSKYFICTICFKFFKSETSAESHFHIETTPSNSETNISSIVNVNDLINKTQIKNEENSEIFVASDSASFSDEGTYDEFGRQNKKLRTTKHTMEKIEKVDEDENIQSEDSMIGGSSKQFKLQISSSIQKIPIARLATNSNQGVYLTQTQSCQLYIQTTSTGLPMCKICKKVSGSVANLITHLKLVHMNVIPLHCQICDESFKIKKHLVSHILSHYPNAIFCDLCTAQFSSYSELLSHNQEEHSHWQVVCYVCGRHFITKKSLKKHLSEHVNVEQSIFIQTNRIRKEDQLQCVKNGNGMYVCKACHETDETSELYTAKRFTAMLLHLMKHFNLRPFKCTVCDERYISKFNLELHVVHSHSRNIFEQVDTQMKS